MSSPPRVRPVVRRSLSDGAFDAVLDAVLSGRLAAGQEVSVVSLAADLGISRTPVHQAVQRLVTLGLFEQPAGKQPRVARFERADVIELYEMRRLLEEAAAERAAIRLADDVIDRLRDEADRLAAGTRAADWPDRALAFDLALHDAVAAGSGSRRLADAIRQYRLLVRAFCRNTGRRENLLAALREHCAILEALADRAPQRARAAMGKHIAARLAVVLAELYPDPAG